MFDYTRKAFSLDSSLKLSYQVTPVYYHNYLNSATFSGYKLQFISFIRTSNDDADVDRDVTMREISLFEQLNGSFTKFEGLPVERKQISVPEDIQKQLLTGMLPLEWFKRVTQAHGSEASADKHSHFSISISFSLSETITQVRVSKRKSWTTTIAEILAFVAGLSFQAKLLKYFMTVNRIGRYYDHLFTLMKQEEKRVLLAKQGLGVPKSGNVLDDSESGNREIELSSISDSVLRRREREGYQSANQSEEEGQRSVRSRKKVKKNIGTSPPKAGYLR